MNNDNSNNQLEKIIGVYFTFQIDNFPIEDVYIYVYPQSDFEQVEVLYNGLDNKIICLSRVKLNESKIKKK